MANFDIVVIGAGTNQVYAPEEDDRTLTLMHPGLHGMAASRFYLIRYTPKVSPRHIGGGYVCWWGMELI